MNNTIIDKQSNKGSRKKITWTFLAYMSRMSFRIILFLFVLFLYFFKKPFIAAFAEPSVARFFVPFSFQVLIWILLMSGMLLNLFPNKLLTMSGKKSRARDYIEPKKSYDTAELYRYVQVMNIKAWQVMLIWLLFNSVFGLLFLLDIISRAEMVLLTFFYYCSDLICMMIFCPFQSFILKNRCCVTCRIFDWGHFMMYTPMLFVKSWFGWTLFFTSCVVLIRWEVLYASHPERFWDGSNSSLRCENCKDRICQIKTPLHEIYRHVHEDISRYFIKKLRR